jgi:hypothetical protein
MYNVYLCIKDLLLFKRHLSINIYAVGIQDSVARFLSVRGLYNPLESKVGQTEDHGQDCFSWSAETALPSAIHLARSRPAVTA